MCWSINNTNIAVVVPRQNNIREKRKHTPKKKKKSTKNIKGCERIWRKMQAVKETVGPVVIGSLRAVKQKFGEWLQQILSNF